jgi:hypothetical protein
MKENGYVGAQIRLRAAAVPDIPLRQVTQDIKFSTQYIQQTRRPKNEICTIPWDFAAISVGI